MRSLDENSLTERKLTLLEKGLKWEQGRYILRMSGLLWYDSDHAKLERSSRRLGTRAYICP